MKRFNRNSREGDGGIEHGDDRPRVDGDLPPHRHDVVRVRSQFPDELIGTGGEQPQLSWAIEGPPVRQTAAEIEVARDVDFRDPIARQFVVGADQFSVEAPGPAPVSREVRYHRVRVETDRSWGPWSAPCRIETGLVEPGDWIGTAITMPDDPGDTAPSPSPLLRYAFDTADRAIRSARLYATASGVYELTINGRAVAPDLLAPGWTTYRRRLLSQTYDVTELVGGGRNCIAGVLGDGWFRGRLEWSGTNGRGRYGDQLALLAQLEIEYVDGTRQVVATDPDWRTSTGEIRRADLYDGCELDMRMEQTAWRLPDFDDTTWAPARGIALDTSTIEPWATPPVRPIDELAVELERIASGDPRVIKVDVGQNITGHLSITVRGARGVEVIVEHAEVVEPDGSLHRRALRTAEARDRFVLADDQTITLVPAFTFHGFRHAEIRTDAEVIAVHAVAISSDLPRRSRFECSDERINRLASNIYWSVRDNFVSIPSDCPQRDERMGWTGDAQAIASTACLLLDARQFWSSWLEDLALDQRPDGVPSVVLDDESARGRAGWADAATIIPWAVYESYGDQTVLERQLPSMIRWVETQRSKRHPEGPRAGLLAGEFQFGDWLDPDAPGDQPWITKIDGDFLANAFFAHSARLTADAAGLLGHSDIQQAYSELADEVAALTWSTWEEHASGSQTGCAVAIMFEIVNDAQRDELGRRLRDLVVDAQGAVSTGFLGTPLVLPALARCGHFNAAYTMVLRDETPSWLYQVAMGATTTWERWDAIRPDGSIHDGAILPHGPDDPVDDDHHMLSFNHYAYGAVLDWIHRHLGGVAPVLGDPGYRSIGGAPAPCESINWAATTVSADGGEVALRWEVSDGRFDAVLDVPNGSTAQFVPPVTSTMTIDGEDTPAHDTDLGPGRHEIRITDPLVHSTSHFTEQR